MNYFDFFIDVEFVGQFTLPKQDPHAERHCTPIIAFLEHSIYVTYAGLREVIVFAGQAPFNKLSTIKINHLEEPYSMVGNAARNALYISDTNSESAGIWQVSLAGKLKVTHQRLGQGGTPGHLSITPNGQLLAVVERHRAMVHDGNLLYPDPDVKDPQQRFSLEIINLDDYSLMKFIQFLPDTKSISSAAQLPDDNFVACYTKCRVSSVTTGLVDTFISVLSSDGRRFIWMLEIGSIFPRIHTTPVPFSFAINEDNSIFLADSRSHNLVLLDPQWNRFCSVWQSSNQLFFPKGVVYRREDGILLVLNDLVPDKSYSSHGNPWTVFVLHLEKKLGD